MAICIPHCICFSFPFPLILLSSDPLPVRRPDRRFRTSFANVKNDSLRVLCGSAEKVHGPICQGICVKKGGSSFECVRESASCAEAKCHKRKAPGFFLFSKPLNSAVMSYSMRWTVIIVSLPTMPCIMDLRMCHVSLCLPWLTGKSGDARYYEGQRGGWLASGSEESERGSALFPRSKVSTLIWNTEVNFPLQSSNVYWKCKPCICM